TYSLKNATGGVETFTLPEREVSILTDYKESRENKLTEEDLKEWHENRKREEPCRKESMTITNGISVQKKREIAAEGSRGIGSELDETRQLAWSTRSVNNTVVRKDDKLAPKAIVATTTTTTVTTNQAQNLVS